MKAEAPARVPLKLSNAEYKAICDGGPIPEPVLPVEDFDEQDAIEDDRAALAIEDAVCTVPPAKRRRVVTVAERAASSSSSGSDSSTEPEDTDPNEVGASASAARQGHNQATGVFIGTKQVLLEQHLKRGGKGAYSGFTLPCGRHIGSNAQGGKTCKKHRNVNVSLGVQGVRES